MYISLLNYSLHDYMIDTALLWVLVGGFLEPLWVIGLKKYNDTHNLAWGAFAVVLMIVSPGCLTFAMQGMSVGVAYAIWTGIGAVMTVISGVVLYKERLDRLKILFIFMVIVGVAGLELSSEVVL